jgi:hypothetical protein
MLCAQHTIHSECCSSYRCVCCCITSIYITLKYAMSTTCCTVSAVVVNSVCIIVLIVTMVCMQVYGALMWGIGRSFKHKSEVPKVYVGSFWDGSKRHPDRYTFLH